MVPGATTCCARSGSTGGGSDERARSALSRFTPSLMSHELLERLFVVRDRLLDADPRARRRGRDEHRAQPHAACRPARRGQDPPRRARLPPHQRAPRCGRRAAGGVAARGPVDDRVLPPPAARDRGASRAGARGRDPALGGGARSAARRTRAGSRGPIVVLVENLDQILDALGNEGQQRLRHLLQADRSLLLVATSTRLDRAAVRPGEPVLRVLHDDAARALRRRRGRRDAHGDRRGARRRGARRLPAGRRRPSETAHDRPPRRRPAAHVGDARLGPHGRRPRRAGRSPADALRRPDAVLPGAARAGCRGSSDWSWPSWPRSTARSTSPSSPSAWRSTSAASARR